ncbi:uncharacterized protein LOC124279896, partial [Haliotis rubra]
PSQTLDGWPTRDRSPTPYRRPTQDRRPTKDRNLTSECRLHDGYTYSQVGICYKLHHTKISWMEAREKCRVEGGDLIKVDTIKRRKVMVSVIGGVLKGSSSSSGSPRSYSSSRASGPSRSFSSSRPSRPSRSFSSSRTSRTSGPSRSFSSSRTSRTSGPSRSFSSSRSTRSTRSSRSSRSSYYKRSGYCRKEEFYIGGQRNTNTGRWVWVLDNTNIANFIKNDPRSNCMELEPVCDSNEVIMDDTSCHYQHQRFFCEIVVE